jgi:hypothetical protein
MLETKITELRGAFSDDEAEQLWNVLTSHKNLKKIDAELDSLLAGITSEMTDTNIQNLITSRAIPQKTECEPCDCLGGIHDLQRLRHDGIRSMGRDKY